MRRMDRKLAEAEAGARFDAAMIIFKKAWAEHYPSEPFVVDGVVTPKAMEYVRGYVDGLQAGEGGTKTRWEKNFLFPDANDPQEPLDLVWWLSHCEPLVLMAARRHWTRAWHSYVVLPKEVLNESSDAPPERPLAQRPSP